MVEREFYSEPIKLKEGKPKEIKTGKEGFDELVNELTKDVDSSFLSTEAKLKLSFLVHLLNTKGETKWPELSSKEGQSLTEIDFSEVDFYLFDLLKPYRENKSEFNEDFNACVKWCKTELNLVSPSVYYLMGEELSFFFNLQKDKEKINEIEEEVDKQIKQLKEFKEKLQQLKKGE